jgi:hypothetical protein
MKAVLRSMVVLAIGICAAVGLADYMNSRAEAQKKAEQETPGWKARILRQDYRRLESETVVRAVEIELAKVHVLRNAPEAWWDICAVDEVQKDAAFLEAGRRVGDKEAAEKLEKLLSLEEPWPDKWSREHCGYELFLATRRLTAWLDAGTVGTDAPGDLPAALRWKKVDAWRRLGSIFPNLPPEVNISQVMRNRYDELEEELASMQTELEHSRLALHVAQAKADGASPAIVEALEAELYGVKLGGAAPTP